MGIVSGPWGRGKGLVATNDRHPRGDRGKEFRHRRMQLHHLPAQSLPCRESKLRSEDIRHLRFERCPVPFFSVEPNDLAQQQGRRKS